MNITFNTLGFEFDFEPSKPYSMTGELTVTTKGQSFGLSVNLKAKKSRNEFADELALLYPDVLGDFLAFKRALGDLYLHVKDEFAIAKAAAEEEADEGSVEEVPDEVLDLVKSETVLEDFVEAVAGVHEVAGDRRYLKLIALGAMSAQLAPLPNGTVLGANVILTADSGRGKNFLCDAVAAGLPQEWVYAFESASAKAFYYKAASNPECFKHTWAYPNEAEATDMLVETLRPLLSSGRATHDTVDTNADGTNEARSLKIEGPITAVIPTIRNKLDGQLQTRMLVVEVADYEGRVKEHTAAFTRTLWASHTGTDHAGTLENWRAALRTLTSTRRVVLPEDPEFVLTSKVSHGARLWRNVCSLILTNAWLQQHNRERVELENGENAVLASAEDYRVAHKVFSDAATRSIDNIGERHVRILNAMYELQADDRGRIRGKGSSLRAIAKHAGDGMNHEMVRTQKAFLLSLGFVVEDDRGALMLIDGAEPTAWGEGKSLAGFPDPDEITKRWGGPKTPDKLDKDNDTKQKPIDIEDSLSNDVLTNGLTDEVLSGELSDEKTGDAPEALPIDKPSPSGNGTVSGLSGVSEGAKEKSIREGETELGSYKTDSRG